MITLLRSPVISGGDPALLDQMPQVMLRTGLLPRPVGRRRRYDDTLLSDVWKENQ